MKILIVDDERIIREGIRRIVPWSNIGIDVVLTADSAKEALEVIERESPEIMLTDINMTEMDGLDLIERVRSSGEDMRVVVLTGYDTFEYAQKCLKMRVQDFLLKPVDEKELSDVIHKQVLALREEYDEQKNKKLMNRVFGVQEQMQLEQLMRNLVSHRCTYEELKIQLAFHDYEIDQQVQAAIIIPVMEPDGTWKEHNDLLHMSIKQICISMFDYQREGITFDDDSGRIVIAVFDGVEFEETVDRIEKLKDMISAEFGIKEKIVLGSLVEGFKDIYISYNDALALIRKAQNNYDDIIQNQSMEHRLTLFNDTFQEIKKNMLSNISNLDKLFRAFDAFETCTESYNLSNSFIRRCCFEIASSIYLAYASTQGESADNKLNALLNSLLVCSREELCKFTREFLSQLLVPKDQDMHEIIGNAKRFIRENLSEDISVSSIAESLYVTPNYFSRLFKKVTGEGCNEYIVRKRIELAKSLLETTSQKTGRIAGMVGYRDTNYFSLAFKKQTGMSPTEYREKSRG